VEHGVCGPIGYSRHQDWRIDVWLHSDRGGGFQGCAHMVRIHASRGLSCLCYQVSMLLACHVYCVSHIHVILHRTVLRVAAGSRSTSPLLTPSRSHLCSVRVSRRHHLRAQWECVFRYGTRKRARIVRDSGLDIIRDAVPLTVSARQMRRRAVGTGRFASRSGLPLIPNLASLDSSQCACGAGIDFP